MVTELDWYERKQGYRHEDESDTMEPRPRGVNEAEAKRLLWAITDRLEARRAGAGVMAQLPWGSFKAVISTLLDEFEEARTA